MANCKECIHYSVCGYVEFQDLECNQFIPTADVVKVVRCENCSHKVNFKGRVMCNKNARKICGEWCGLTATNNNHFCSYGTPKESEVQGE